MENLQPQPEPPTPLNVTVRSPRPRDYLTECEVERLMDAESAFNSEPPAPRYDKDHGYGEYSHHGRSYKKRKKNFLEELFD